MPVPTTLRGISTSASANSPAGSDTIGSSLDDYLRSIQAVFRQFLASQGTNMASAATVDLSTADGYYINITGNTTMTGLGTEAAGISYLLKFASTPQLTHSSSLVLPGAANITAAAGDVALFVSEGSGNWRCANYQPVTTAPAEKIPTTKGDILAATASGTLARLGVGTDGQVLTAHASATAGVKWAAPTNGITLATDTPSTSGASVDFAVPSGVKRITVMLNQVSSNGTSPFQIQLGDAGGVETSGYVAYSGTRGGESAVTSGFLLNRVSSAATDTFTGVYTLTLQNAATFQWTGFGVVSESSANTPHFGSGIKATSAEVTTVRITTVNGTDTFDAGAINIAYE